MLPYTRYFTGVEILDRCGNDPSAGSPTETLLRLHLPLSDKVRTSSRGEFPIKEANYNPEASPEHSIGRCDGRCVLWEERRGGDEEIWIWSVL